MTTNPKSQTPTQRRQTTAQPALGIDIGRVLMCPTTDDGRPDTSFLGADDRRAMEVPPVPLMFDVVPDLVRAFAGRAHLVSKAGPRIEALTWRWLDHHRFFDRTGIARDQVHFCRRREEKRAHAAALGLTHFIDDRQDVLGHLRGLVPNLYLFGVQTSAVPPWVVHVADWLAASEAVSPTAATAAGSG